MKEQSSSSGSRTEDMRSLTRRQRVVRLVRIIERMFQFNNSHVMMHINGQELQGVNRSRSDGHASRRVEGDVRHTIFP